MEVIMNGYENGAFSTANLKVSNDSGIEPSNYTIAIFGSRAAGVLMFGTKMPEGGWDLIIKIGVMIGGLFSMVNPPQIVKSHLRYYDNPRDVIKGAKDSVAVAGDGYNKANKGYRFAKYKYLRRKRKLRDAAKVKN